MTARIKPSVTEWVEWCQSEALVSGWLSVRPYASPNNRAGAPEMLLARNGVNVAVWVRPVGKSGPDGLTIAQRQWAEAMLGDEVPVPTVDEPLASVGAVMAVLAHPTAESRDMVRWVLDHG